MKAETSVEQVASQVLKKLGEYVSAVQPENLSPQTMKHITATLKDIRDLQEQPDTGEGLSIRVEFGKEDWCT